MLRTLSPGTDIAGGRTPNRSTAAAHTPIRPPESLHRAMTGRNDGRVSAPPTPSDIRRWRRYLADERAEAAVYRDLASRRDGEERAILLDLADAEGRHEQHWLHLLGDQAGKPRKGALRTRWLGFLARRFGSVFVLALAQRAEARAVYEDERDATPQMVADERIHEEVVRSLAARGRARLSGSFRAAVFGMNDGLVSNLALVLGIGATGVAPGIVLATGIAGLLAGALSMAAGEYVSVRSQRELLEASTPIRSPGPPTRTWTWRPTSSPWSTGRAERASRTRKRTPAGPSPPTARTRCSRAAPTRSTRRSVPPGRPRPRASVCSPPARSSPCCPTWWASRIWPPSSPPPPWWVWRSW